MHMMKNVEVIFIIIIVRYCTWTIVESELSLIIGQTVVRVADYSAKKNARIVQLRRKKNTNVMSDDASVSADVNDTTSSTRTIHFTRRGVYHTCPRYVKSMYVKSIGQLHVLVRTDKDDPETKTDYNAENLYFYIDEICMMILRSREFKLLKLRGAGDTWSESLRHQLVKHNILIIYASQMEVLRTRNMCEKNGFKKRFDYLYPRICPCKDVITLLGRMSLKKEPMMHLVKSMIQLISQLNESLANPDHPPSDLDKETKEEEDTSVRPGMKLGPHVKRKKFRGKAHTTKALQMKIAEFEREDTFCDGEPEPAETGCETSTCLEKEAATSAVDHDDATPTNMPYKLKAVKMGHGISEMDFKFKEVDADYVSDSETDSDFEHARLPLSLVRSRGANKKKKKQKKKQKHANPILAVCTRPNRIVKPPRRDSSFVDSTLYIPEDVKEEGEDEGEEEFKMYGTRENQSKKQDEDESEADDRVARDARGSEDGDGDDDADGDDNDDKESIPMESTMVTTSTIEKPVETEPRSEAIPEPAMEAELVYQEDPTSRHDVEVMETSSAPANATLATCVDLSHFITAEPQERFAMAGALYNKDFVYTAEMQDISVVLVTTSTQLRTNVQRNIQNLLLIKRNDDQDMYINLYELDGLFPGALEHFTKGENGNTRNMAHVLATKIEMATLVASGLTVDYSQISRRQAAICIRLLDATMLLRTMHLYDPAVEMSMLAARIQEERANRELQKRLAQESDSVFGMKIILPDKIIASTDERKHDHVFSGYEDASTTSDVVPCSFARSDSLESIESQSSIDSIDSAMSVAQLADAGDVYREQYRITTSGDSFHTPKSVKNAINISNNKRRLFEMEQSSVADNGKIMTHYASDLSGIMENLASPVKRSRIQHHSDLDSDLEAMRLHLDFDHGVLGDF